MGIQTFRRFLEKIEKGQLFFCMACLGGIAIVMFLEVLMRNAFGINLQWALEFSSLLMVWICFIGTSVVYRRKGHIAIEAMVRLFPRHFQKFINLCMFLLIGLGLTVLVAKAGSLMIVQYGQEIVSLGIPRSFLSLPIVLGIGFMIVTTIYLFLGEMFNPGLPERNDSP